MEEFGVGVVVVESCDGEVELVRGLGDDGGVAACSDEDECWCGRHGWCIGCFRGKKREGRSRSVDRPLNATPGCSATRRRVGRKVVLSLLVWSSVDGLVLISLPPD